MDLSKLPIFSMLQKRMGWLTQRQNILAENIANADTPNYKARKIADFEFAKVLRQSGAGGKLGVIAPRQTSAAHMVGLKQDRAYAAKESREPYEVTISGNTVVLEEQMMRVAETQMAYQLTTNLYKKHLGMLKTALRGGGA